MKTKSDALRRYPALIYLAGAGLLGLLLPSALSVPQSGPNTLAEYAPQSGEGEGTSDFSELGGASSGGVGFGKGESDPTAGDVNEDLAQRFIPKGGNKNCVGSPARQTEDPLSPPCHAFFDADNGGSTAKGVTRNEVRVLVQMDGVQNDPQAGQVVNCTDEVRENDSAQDLGCKAYMRYFNSRYQTYGRVVTMFNRHLQTNAAFDESLNKYDPFASVAASTSSAPPKVGVLSAGYTGQPRNAYQSVSPLMMGFRPDLEDHTKNAASYICTKLYNKPAQYAGDPTLRSTTRKFAIWRNADSGGSTSSLKSANLLRDQLKSQCGLDIPDSSMADHYQPNKNGQAARLKAANHTTVIGLYGTSGITLVTSEASSSGFLPEWVLPMNFGQRDLDGNFYARTADQAQWANAFGLSVDYRKDNITEQPWYRAFREGCPDCPVPTVNGSSNFPYIYDALQLFFYGLQSAGPKLTHANVDRGLHSVKQDRSTNPYKPAAYFDPGNYTFVKDAVPIWWDPSGTPPGSANKGCYRLLNEGARYRAGDWQPGDSDIKAPGPCQADAFQ